MKVLLDEMIPRQLGPMLQGHEVHHSIALGWRKITNGQLLALAESQGFQVLISKDGNMPYQQNLSGRVISVVILKPKSQLRESTLAMADLIANALVDLKPGQFVRLKHE